MAKRILLALIAFFVIGACTFGAGALVEPETALKPITPGSPCPVVGCVSGECHSFDNVPTPDGIHEMNCPETTCSDVTCHAWEFLMTGYHRANNASLDIWILAPVAFVAALIAMVRALSHGKFATTGSVNAAKAQICANDSDSDSKEETM